MRHEWETWNFEVRWCSRACERRSGRARGGVGRCSLEVDFGVCVCVCDGAVSGICVCVIRFNTPFFLGVATKQMCVLA